jgi:hypothetical protein
MKQIIFHLAVTTKISYELKAFFSGNNPFKWITSFSYPDLHIAAFGLFFHALQVTSLAN